MTEIQINFPSFWEGLSLRHFYRGNCGKIRKEFPFLSEGTFIEAICRARLRRLRVISLPFWRGFH